MTENYFVNALRIESGVNMGDHAQDVTTAIDVRPDDTIGSLVDRHMTVLKYVGTSTPEPVPDPSVSIVIRVALDRDDVVTGGAF